MVSIEKSAAMVTEDGPHVIEVSISLFNCSPNHQDTVWTRHSYEKKTLIVEHRLDVYYPLFCTAQRNAAPIDAILARNLCVA